MDKSEFRKKIFDKYNKNDKMIYVINQTIKDNNLEFEEVAEYIKEDSRLLRLIEIECTELNLLKKERNKAFDLRIIFGEI